MSNGTALIAAVRSGLAAGADPERAAGQQRYMKSEMPFRGLSSPVLRTMLRPILADPAHSLESRAEWESTIRTLWDEASYREERYAALALAQHRRYRSFLDAQSLPLSEHLTRTGAWWDLVDDIATHLVAPVLLGDRAETTPIIRAWAQDPDLWVRRVAILSQLPAKDETDRGLLSYCLETNLPESTFGSEFFIRKAVGWALRQFAKTDPEWVREFVGAHELSPLSRREALKHLG